VVRLVRRSWAEGRRRLDGVDGDAPRSTLGSGRRRRGVRRWALDGAWLLESDRAAEDDGRDRDGLAEGALGQADLVKRRRRWPAAHQPGDRDDHDAGRTRPSLDRRAVRHPAAPLDGPLGLMVTALMVAYAAAQTPPAPAATPAEPEAAPTTAAAD